MTAQAATAKGAAVLARFSRNGRLMRWGVKPAVFLACLVPAAVLVWDAVAGLLGANPVEALLHRSGDWALRLLLVTLAATPLRILTGWAWPIRLRRMLGLFSFFYASVHFTVYLWLDRQLVWSEIVVDIAERPYITLGFSAFLILVALAATSPRVMVRRLGRNWQRLHRSVYAASVLGVIHYWWLVKADVREPMIYAGVLGALLGVRAFRKRARGSPGRAGRT